MVRVNYETGSGTAFKVYGGNSSTLYASFTGATSIEFPGLAAGSGHSCLQIDTSGYVTNTGAACGSGSGTSGTVNSSNAGYIAYYTATGTAIGGVSSVPVNAGGTGATTAAGALAALGALPLAGGTLTGALAGTSAGFSGPLTASSSITKMSPAVNAAAYGLVADGLTDIGAAVQAAWNASGGLGTVLLPCNTSSGCYWANPNTMSWGTMGGTLLLQGNIRFGTTLATPTNLGVVIAGDDGHPVGAGQTSFSSAAQYAALSFPNDIGTLGTAVSMTEGTPTSATFTPSSMTGLLVGSWITVVDPATCSISTVTRYVATNGATQTTAQFTGACPIPAGVPITVAGVADSSFNGGPANGNCPFMTTDTDAVKNTITWCSSGSPASSTGGTVTGLNAESVDQVPITAVTSTTATGTFHRSHVASADWGIVGLVVGPGQTNLIKNLQISAPGTAIVNMGYNDDFDHVAAGAGCPLTYLGQAISPSFPFVDWNASFTKIDHSSLLNTCGPWSVQMTNYAYVQYTSGQEGELAITHSVLGRSLEEDHGGAGATLRDSTCDQCTSLVRFDPTNYGSWAQAGNNVVLENIEENDNNLGSPLYGYFQTNPESGASYGTVSITDMWGFASNTTNNYVTSGVHTDTPYQYGTGTAQGVYGTFDNGLQREGEIRGINAAMAPSVIPYATANVPQSGWSGYCTVSGPVAALDSSQTAYALKQNTGPYTGAYSANITAQVGDVYLFGADVSTPNYGYAATAGATGGNVFLSNNGNSHYSFNYQPLGNSAVFGLEAGLINDWGHPVVGEATVTSADGTPSLPLYLYLSCDSAHTINYSNPWLMPIPSVHFTGTTDGSTGALTSVTAPSGYTLKPGMIVTGPGIVNGGSEIQSISGSTVTLSDNTTVAGSAVALVGQISQAEINRIRTQLMHGYVPPNVPGGVLALDPNLPIYYGSNPLIPAGSLPLVGFKSYSGSGTPIDTCSATSNPGVIETNASLASYQCSNATGSYAWNAMGGSSGGVTQIVAGSGISISPSGGTGLVTVSATGTGGGGSLPTIVTGGPTSANCSNPSNCPTIFTSGTVSGHVYQVCYSIDITTAGVNTNLQTGLTYNDPSGNFVSGSAWSIQGLGNSVGVPYGACALVTPGNNVPVGLFLNQYGGTAATLSWTASYQCMRSGGC